MIKLSVPSIPPSLNNVYMDLPPRRGPGGKLIHGGRAMTEEGKKYKKDTTAWLSRHYPTALASLKKDVAYNVYVRFYFPAIENKGWPEKAETRYKRIDVTNRLKVFEDALKDAAGIDDAQHLAFLGHKVEGDPLTEVFIWSDEEASPFDAFFDLR